MTATLSLNAKVSPPRPLRWTRVSEADLVYRTFSFSLFPAYENTVGFFWLSRAGGLEGFAELCVQQREG